MKMFLADDYHDLLVEIQRLSKKIRAVSQTMAEGMGQDAGNAIHDNPAYEEGHRQLRMWAKHLDGLLKMRDESQIVQLPPLNGRVQLGSTVTVMDIDTLTIETIKIGSYQSFRPNIGPDPLTVSYPAPLAKMLIGAVVEDRRTAMIAGKPKTLRVLDIQ